MLSKLKKDGKGKKEVKKEAKPKKEAVEAQPDNIHDDEEELTDLVDIDYTSKPKEDNKPKLGKKKNESTLEERQIDIASIKIEKKQEKPRTTWVANNVADVIKTDFKMDEHEHEFDSLTDQDFNSKQKEKHQAKVLEDKLKQKPERDESTGISFAPLQKTRDQLLMEKAEEADGFNFRKVENSGSVATGLPINSATRNFINSKPIAGSDLVFAPVEKSKQELMMEEAERKEQDAIAKQKTASWIGAKKPDSNSPPKAFKANPWAVSAAQGVAPTGVKFAPLTHNIQEQKMAQGRQEQEFICVSKKEMEERKKKREERDRLGQNPKIAQ